MNAAAQEALRRLVDGAKRHAAGRATGLLDSPAHAQPEQASPRITAAVLACAEPGTSPETIFGEFPGGLFVVRTAGHVLDDATLGSLEFAVAELDASLVVVLGHEGCRAVSAAITRPTAIGDLGIILDAIEPAVLRARHRSGSSPANLLEEAVTEHIRAAVRDLRGSRIIHPYIDRGEVWLVGAKYSATTRRLTWLQEPGEI